MIEYLLKLDDEKAPSKRLAKIKDGHFCISYKMGRRTETYDIALERCPNHAETVKWAFDMALIGQGKNDQRSSGRLAFNHNQKKAFEMISDKVTQMLNKKTN
ncbi:hypothetical protein GCM10010995_15380 [Cysteiniphilum litorale]|uniref:Uncharacterized protein n=2 Tax=Cysteiniphilum litorale TaxID=2056700 RepID=A0A8J2Z4K5_9GAMM|nr:MULTISPECIES: hypothetical protein [Cysteiniphilum]GGF99036.1 hypothetical protein GCM10010995_15380 [Cysteiniphilum litorale]